MMKLQPSKKTASVGIGKIHNVKGLDLKKVIALPNATLVDARTPVKFNIEYIKGAINIDLVQTWV